MCIQITLKILFQLSSCFRLIIELPPLTLPTSLVDDMICETEFFKVQWHPCYISNIFKVKIDMHCALFFYYTIDVK